MIFVDVDKLHDISEKLVMGVIGDPGDATQFAQFVSSNAQLYKIKNGYPLETPALVHFIRQSLATTLRSEDPTMVNMLLGGYDEKTGGELYSVDFCASCVKIPYAVHGAGALILGLLGHHYRPTLTETEAYEVIKLCVREMHSRLFLNLRSFQVKIISKDGVKKKPCITRESLMKTNR